MKLDLTPVSRFANKALYKCKAKSPEILFAVGVIGFGMTIYHACKATTKLEPIVEEHEKAVARIEDIKNAQDICRDRLSSEEIAVNEEGFKKDICKAHIDFGLHLLKNYAPAIVFGVLSIGCFYGSNHILHVRNAQLMTAYTAISKAYDEYRKRVREEYGEDADYKLAHNIPKDVPIEEAKNIVEGGKAKEGSRYEYLFFERNQNYTNNCLLNLNFLTKVERWANQQLQIKGYLFLRDVLNALGVDITDEGVRDDLSLYEMCTCGWVYRPNDPTFTNVVDFGLRCPDNNDFFDGIDPAALLHFNVDGIIIDKI